jgi:hypothetical protein
MIVGDLMIESQASDGKTTALFEDNGKVAYCYIIEDGKIISDVWLYNRETAPLSKPWKFGVPPPYLNPIAYSEKINRLPKENEDVQIEWDIKDGTPIAVMSIFGEKFGYLSSLTKPGFARLALKDGPLARTMQSSMAAGKLE